MKGRKDTSKKQIRKQTNKYRLLSDGECLQDIHPAPSMSSHEGTAQVLTIWVEQGAYCDDTSQQATTYL